VIDWGSRKCLISKILVTVAWNLPVRIIGLSDKGWEHDIGNVHLRGALNIAQFLLYYLWHSGTRFERTERLRFLKGYPAARSNRGGFWVTKCRWILYHNKHKMWPPEPFLSLTIYSYSQAGKARPNLGELLFWVAIEYLFGAIDKSILFTYGCAQTCNWLTPSAQVHISAWSLRYSPERTTVPAHNVLLPITPIRPIISIVRSWNIDRRAFSGN
jgi:hypothetical protein